MRLPHRSPEPLLVPWRQDQVDVIGHEAPGPDLDARPLRLFGQQVAIDLLIPVLEEDRLTPIAPLGHVVRKTRNDDAGEASHTHNL